MKTRKYERVVDKVIFFCSNCKKTSSIRQDSFSSGTKIQFGDCVPSFITKSKCLKLLKKKNQWLVLISKGNLLPALRKISSTIWQGKCWCWASNRRVTFRQETKISQGKSFQRYWILVISSQVDHKCCVQLLPPRDRETLQDINVVPVSPEANTRIVSDGWTA